MARRTASEGGGPGTEVPLFPGMPRGLCRAVCPPPAGDRVLGGGGGGAADQHPFKIYTALHMFFQTEGRLWYH